MNPGCDCVTMLPCPGGPSGLKPGCAKAGTAAGCVKGAPGTLKLCIPPGFPRDSHSLHSTISLRILSATWKLSWSSFELLHSTKSKKVGDVWTYEHGDKFYMGKNRQTSWCVTRGVNFQAHGFVAGQGAPCEAWPLTRLKGLDKKLDILEISINTSELELLVKITFEAEIVTLKFLKMNSGLNGRINNPCRISSACRLGGLKTVWRGARNPYYSSLLNGNPRRRRKVTNLKSGRLAPTTSPSRPHISIFVFTLEVQLPFFIGWFKFTNHCFLIVKVYHHPKWTLFSKWRLTSRVHTEIIYYPYIYILSLYTVLQKCWFQVLFQTAVEIHLENSVGRAVYCCDSCLSCPAMFQDNTSGQVTSQLVIGSHSSLRGSKGRKAIWCWMTCILHTPKRWPLPMRCKLYSK